MGTTLGSTGITFNDATVQTTAAAVASVGGNTGAITNAQIAASATAGYGYTPANPANVVAKDSNFGVGCFAIGSSGMYNSGTFTSLGCAAGATTAYFTAGDTSGGFVGQKAGTWRNLSTTTATGGPAKIGLYQRIA